MLLLLWLWFFMIFPTCCCLRIAASRGRLGQIGRVGWQAVSVPQVWGSANMFFRIKSVVLFSKQNCIVSNCLFFGKLPRDGLQKTMQNAHFWWYCPQIWKGICPVLCPGSILFLSAPATDKIICIQLKTFQWEGKLPLSPCFGYCNF